MGLTHCALRAKLNRELEVDVTTLLLELGFDGTFGELLACLRGLRDSVQCSSTAKLKSMSDDEIWEVICQAVAYARFPDELTIVRDDAVSHVLRY